MSEELDVILAEMDPEELKALQEEAQAERDKTFADIAEEIEKKWITDVSRRARKELEWVCAERLLLGSTAKFYNRWGDKDSPFGKNGQQEDNDVPEHNIIRTKHTIAKAQLEMLQFGQGSDKNFTIRPKMQSEDVEALKDKTPVIFEGEQLQHENGEPKSIADLAQEKIQEDAEAARKMDEEVFAQLATASYGKKIRDGFDSLLTYGIEVYRGPINNIKCSKKKVKKEIENGKSIWITEYNEHPIPDFDCVNPWLFYWDYRALTIEDAEHATVVHILSPTQFRALHKRPGFFGDQIAKIMKEGVVRSDCYNAFYTQASRYDNNDYIEGKYIVIEWHGTVTKDHLGKLGIESPTENPFDAYRAEIWVCQGSVIFAKLEMLEEVDELPFAVNVWEKDPSSLAGFGEVLLRDPQRVVNKTYEMILHNAGLSALPMWAINLEMMKPIDGLPEIGPGKAFTMTEYGADVSKAIQFFHIPSNLTDLTTVLNMAKAFGDEESCIPLLTGGMGDPQLGDTGATGMAMFMQAGTSVLSSKSRAHDDNVTSKIVNWFYEYNMQFSAKEDIKCDCEIDVQTSTAYLQKVMAQRDLERVALMAAQNPQVEDYLDIGELYRAMFAGMSLPYDRLVFSREKTEEIKAKKAQAQQQQPNPDEMKAQASLMQAEAKSKQVDLEGQQLQFDSTKGMQQAQWDHEEKMEQYRVRAEEAKTRAYEADREYQLELAKVHQADVHKELDIKHKDYVADSKHNTDKFMKGIDANQNQQKINLEAEMVKVKEKEAQTKAKHKAKDSK